MLAETTLGIVLLMASATQTSSPAQPTDLTPSLTIAESPSLGPHAALYATSRPPLKVRPLIKLPPQCIRPGGWLRTQLNLMRDGLVGHLDEISGFCRPESGWLDPEGKTGWEEAPYWLRGFGELGCVLDDPRIIATTKTWLDAAIKSQQPDGWFGPRDNKARKDAWPNTIMLFAL
ncbi:MAG: glycoside hydrolase family 127 protein, partial [Planctomycetes bacterium]|nr:glycoside hydrolase family 127 protein [Planctomycetota bacterium]